MTYTTNSISTLDNGRNSKSDIHNKNKKKPKHAIKFEDVKVVVTFVMRHAEENVLPQPAAKFDRDGEAPIFLPASCTKAALHKAYVDSCEAAGKRSVGLTSFQDIWRACCDHVQISSIRTDVCAKCETHRNKIMLAQTEEEKLETTASFVNHIEQARKEHDAYIQCVKKARDEFDIAGAPAPLPGFHSSTSLIHVHYSFDFAQGVNFPHLFRQVGPIYFVTPRKVQVFGVCLEGAGLRYNYLIDENETIGMDGKNSHGPNAVISLLHHSLENYAYGEKACILHCDNCFGQNKNRYTMAYLAWRVMRGYHVSIILQMQIPGHTKCYVDAGFGQFRKLYRRSAIDTMKQLVDVVTHSSCTNRAVRIDDTVAWLDWKGFLDANFKALPGIRKYHHFRFSALNPGVVFCSSAAWGEETTFLLLKNEVSITDELPEVIPAGGLSRERAQYLYTHVRPFVNDPYKNITCPVVDLEE